MTPKGRRGVWAASTALLVVAGIVAAVLAARAVARSDSGASRISFHLSSAEVASTLRLAIQHEEDLVMAASATVGGDPTISPRGFDGWARSARALERYPELLDIGVVQRVPASRLHAFEASLAAQPVEPLGPGTGPWGRFEVVPQGTRPVYCFARAGIARGAASAIPPGLDYCSFGAALLPSRDTGATSYAPFKDGQNVTLGVETPVYRSGVVPSSVRERRREFVGWLGELILPSVILHRALQGHAGTAVRFSYNARGSHVSFGAGKRSGQAQTATFDLRNGWTVQTYAQPPHGGIFSDRNSLLVLIGGSLLALLVGLLAVVLGTSRMRALALVREKTRELSHQAMHDTLTGLPNRALVLDRAEQMIARVSREPGALAGALFIDVDGFKRVNDKLGHAAGDSLLKVVGERLLSAVRAQDTVGRLGGDEFVVLVEAHDGGQAAEALAARLIELVRAPVELEDGRRLFSVTASVGLALGRYATPDRLLRDADLALYAAKAEGKDRYVLFDAGLDRDAEGRHELALELGAAVQEDQLFLLYQPIFEMPGERVVGVEALLRWRHPERSVVGANDFVPLAEESGLIVPIGRWVLEHACAQAARWEREGHRLGVSVNVSSTQLARSAFAHEVRGALESSGLDPALLTLEVSEAILMHDLAGACARLQEVRELGVHIAIDRFGAGYASLSQLQRMPVDMLKLDRSFVAALGEDDGSRELFEAVVAVGQALSLRVVAEGVEAASQMTTVQEAGCHMAQGFLMAKPSTPEAIASLLAGANGNGAAPHESALAPESPVSGPAGVGS
jgi:diguanylate cyclase (GGDEF)-like protein